MPHSAGSRSANSFVPNTPRLNRVSTNTSGGFPSARSARNISRHVGSCAANIVINSSNHIGVARPTHTAAAAYATTRASNNQPSTGTSHRTVRPLASSFTWSRSGDVRSARPLHLVCLARHFPSSATRKCPT